MKKVLAFAVVVLWTSSVFAAEPFQASLTPDIAIHGSDVMIEGLVLSIWGENPQRALALGLANGSTGDSSGFTWSWLLNYADSYKGVQWAAINYNKQDFLGWQSGCVNYAGGSCKGLQTGWVNFAGDLNGLQLGLLNLADRVDQGVQIGILNFMKENEE
ncbi:MAG: hypothetical protein K9N51_12920, partial [Candidatus Pacebacteria bacterium]|nr:hypothetical protein [Candidatus Paceibacterota bacterium]